MTVKPCPICGGCDIRLNHYAVPSKYYPSSWEEKEDGVVSPITTMKYIECATCGATVKEVSFSPVIAKELWNEETDNGVRKNILQYIESENLEVKEDDR